MCSKRTMPWLLSGPGTGPTLTPLSSGQECSSGWWMSCGPAECHRSICFMMGLIKLSNERSRDDNLSQSHHSLKCYFRIWHRSSLNWRSSRDWNPLGAEMSLVTPHLCGEGLRWGLRGTWIPQVLQQPGAPPPLFGLSPLAGEAPVTKQGQEACDHSAEAPIQNLKLGTLSSAPPMSSHIGWGSDCPCSSLGFLICKEAMMTPSLPTSLGCCRIKGGCGEAYRNE